MLGEFKESLDIIISALESVKKIADNSGVDDIDMTTLEFDFPTLIDLAFGVKSNLIMPQILARKEAYDCLAGHLRLATIYSRGRDYYYNEAEAEIDAGIEHLKYLDGVFTSLEQFSDR